VQELLRGEAHGIDKILLVAGAEAGSARLQHIMEAAEQQGVTVGQGSKRALFDLVGNVPHQGVVAIVRAFVYTPLAQLGLTGRGNQEKLLLACDQLQDPHNLGSLVRSAAALGACGMVIPKDRACEVTPAVVKTAAGATSHLPIARVVNMVRALQDLKARGYWITGTLPDAPVALSELDLRGPTVIVLGSEGAGLRPLVARTCDTLARIPMADEIGSLNAAVAGAICLYEVARQRLTG
jgi:23S rRNA (guanosine2251-2'-O)-methyltransferase